MHLAEKGKVMQQELRDNIDIGDTFFFSAFSFSLYKKGKKEAPQASKKVKCRDAAGAEKKKKIF